MILATLTIAAQLNQQPAQGIQLKPAYTITKPIDIQPTITVWQLQPTFDPQRASGVELLQNAAKVDTFQDTHNPQQ